MAKQPENYAFLGGDRADNHQTLLQRPDISGAQIIYHWRKLEPEKGVYDFSAIERDLAVMDGLDKGLFVQVQDRFFSPEARHLPDYLLSDDIYGGGLAAQLDRPGEGKALVAGWVAMQWNPAVRERFQLLLAALGERFDGRLAGINLPETSFDGDGAKDAAFCEAYFDAAMDNMRALRRAFTQSPVVQYVNFWPCEWNNDHGYMERVFAEAAAIGVGMGGPDVVPWRRGQMKNSYPFFNRHMGDVPLVAMAVQEATLTYRNPQSQKPFTRTDFACFARDYLGADIIFWSAASPWLAEGTPYLSNDLNCPVDKETE